MERNETGIHIHFEAKCFARRKHTTLFEKNSWSQQRGTHGVVFLISRFQDPEYPKVDSHKRVLALNGTIFTHLKIESEKWKLEKL